MSCIYSKKALELLYTTKANFPTVLAGICDKVQAKASLLINLVFIDFKNNILIVTTQFTVNVSNCSLIIFFYASGHKVLYVNMLLYHMLNLKINTYSPPASLRWSWTIAWCLQSRASCFAVSSARTKACTSAAHESMASRRPWPASPSKSSRGRLWTSSWHVTMPASLTRSKTGLQEATGPGCLVALTAGPAHQAKSASRVHGSRISCSWLGHRTCRTLRSTAKGCGATTSWGGNIRACWRNTARHRRAPGRLAARALVNVTGRQGISVRGRCSGEMAKKKEKMKEEKGTKITLQHKMNWAAKRVKTSINS